MFIGQGNQFWMGGLHATRLAEVTDDPSRLDDGNFWAVLASFEGKYHFARFKKVTEQAFPVVEPWQRLERPWKSSQEMIDYIAYVHDIRESIAAGGVYQVNACRELSHFLGDKPQKLESLFAAILKAHPAPFASYLKIPGY